VHACECVSAGGAGKHCVQAPVPRKSGRRGDECGKFVCSKAVHQQVQVPVSPREGIPTSGCVPQQGQGASYAATPAGLASTQSCIPSAYSTAVQHPLSPGVSTRAATHAVSAPTTDPKDPRTRIRVATREGSA